MGGLVSEQPGSRVVEVEVDDVVEVVVEVELVVVDVELAVVEVVLLVNEVLLVVDDVVLVVGDVLLVDVDVELAVVVVEVDVVVVVPGVSSWEGTHSSCSRRTRTCRTRPSCRENWSSTATGGCVASGAFVL